MQQPIITIFASFTRRWAIAGWLDNLAAVEHDPALTNLTAIVDCDEPYIANMLKQFAEKYNYRSFHVKVNEDWHPNEVRLAIRRMRVADVHNQSKDLIAKTDGEIIIGLEDDTAFDRLKSFERFYRPILDDAWVGYVEGVQVGRWGANMIGAWMADDVFNPKQVKTLLPADGYQKITGGGWYGYATRRQLWLNTPYFTSPSHPWGPDLEFCFWIRRQGYKCLIDWCTIFGHRDHSKTLYPDSPKIRLAQIVYTKDEQTGKWERTDHEPTRY